MQTENTIGLNTSWKNLDSKIAVGHFSSSSPAPGYGDSQIYVKRFDSLLTNPKNKITIFLLHDICQYHGRFQTFINWMRLQNPNIVLVAMDFVGHGLSSGTRGHIEKLEYLVNDCHYLLNQFEKKATDEKWLILGHGLGGLVALDLLNRFQESMDKKVDGLILSNFILKFSSTLLQLEEQSLIEKIGLKNIISHIRPLRLLKGNELLTMADDILNYERDPLVIHRPTLSSIKEIQRKTATIFQDSYFLDKPVMLLNSEHNPVSSNNSIAYFSKGIKKDLLTEKNYSHMKHDLYNEREKETVFSDIMNWMKSYEI